MDWNEFPVLAASTVANSCSLFRTEFEAAAGHDFEDQFLGQYAEMFAQGATTFWEQDTGQAEYSLAGSLCHGWSAAPVYYAKALLLGVQPVEDGFRAFRVTPFDSGRFAEMHGAVPTPHGDIRVDWVRRDDRLQLSVHAPEACRMIPSTLECP